MSTKIKINAQLTRFQIWTSFSEIKNIKKALIDKIHNRFDDKCGGVC